MAVKLIKPGDKDPLVTLWKVFLTDLHLYNGTINHHYDGIFREALIKFQNREKINSHGFIDNATWLCGLQQGLQLNDDEQDSFPFKPDFTRFTAIEMVQNFGFLQFEHDPIPDNIENIKILNNFQHKNIVYVSLPQLSVATSGEESGMLFHKKGVDQLKAFYSEIEKTGLLKKVLTFNGSFVPRLVRNSKTRLSNHSFGTAFDINAQWNALGCTPAALGTKGSVRELVPLAHEYGFYWGGHFSRKDGMHFEIAKIL